MDMDEVEKVLCSSSEAESEEEDEDSSSSSTLNSSDDRVDCDFKPLTPPPSNNPKPLEKSSPEDFVRSDSKNSSSSKVVQSHKARRSKIENDRAKRFEYLLQQTEFHSHFMKTAYKEALNFSNSDPDKSSSSSAKLTKVEDKKKLASKGSQSESLTAEDFISHFDSTPTFIQGGSMRDYQVRGLNWLISLYDRGLSGILADEMGLGKTLQTISMLGYLKAIRGKQGPHLIIAPKSTLPNWMNELNRWCPSLKAICFIGNKDERSTFITSTFVRRNWNVCVTSYDIARIEKSVFSRINYHYVIIDEAQRIKNENSLLSSIVRTFKSTVRLLLTGTPLQNNLHELWALLNFLLPDVFSSSEDFDSWFNESNCMENQSLIDRLHAVLRPFLLRRIKSDVEKSLLPKSEMRIYVRLTPMQLEWYRKILMNDIDVITNSGTSTKMRLQNTIMHLRKVCNHPYLFEGAEPKPFTTDSHIVNNSGKMIVLDKLLIKLKAQQSRVLLFAQMTRLLDIIEDYCIWRNFEYSRLDGGTDYDIRQEDIDAFNAPNSTKFIYLLSTRAGGLGINLASANIVILYDSDWNPQVDLQAMDRAHRIGQTKQVQVFRFCVQDTAEEKIIECAAAKLHLDKAIIQQGRLVGSGIKAPNKVELTNIVRFGAESILNKDENVSISDADIETVIMQSKIRSEALDRHLVNMKEENLRNLSIEQVEFKWTPAVATTDRASSYKFEGKDYRELRKRRSVFATDDLNNIVSGKRRKTNNYGALYDDSDIDETGSTFSTPRKAPSTPVSKQHLPKKPADFQFFPPYSFELHNQEMDYHKKLLKLKEEPRTSDGVNDLITCETNRIMNCGNLSPFEKREKSILQHEGFKAWTKTDFNQFIKVISIHGSDDLEVVAKSLKKKEIEEVVRFSQIFWLKCHELHDFEEIMSKLNHAKLIEDRRLFHQTLIERKIDEINQSSVKIVYDPENWIGKRFKAEDDVNLLKFLKKIGMQTPNVFGVLHAELSKSTNANTCSPFLRTRTKEELHERFNLLIYMLEKEYGAQQDNPAL